MPSLVSWGDLFKYNKELFDDDYNPGQKLTVKTKCTSEDKSNVLSLPPLSASLLGTVHHYQDVWDIGRRCPQTWLWRKVQSLFWWQHPWNNCYQCRWSNLRIQRPRPCQSTSLLSWPFPSRNLPNKRAWASYSTALERQSQRRRKSSSRLVSSTPQINWKPSYM